MSVQCSYSYLSRSPGHRTPLPCWIYPPPHPGPNPPPVDRSKASPFLVCFFFDLLNAPRREIHKSDIFFLPTLSRFPLSISRKTGFPPPLRSLPLHPNFVPTLRKANLNVTQAPPLSPLGCLILLRALFLFSRVPPTPLLSFPIIHQFSFFFFYYCKLSYPKTPLFHDF